MNKRLEFHFSKHIFFLKYAKLIVEVCSFLSSLLALPNFTLFITSRFKMFFKAQKFCILKYTAYYLNMVIKITE